MTFRILIAPLFFLMTGVLNPAYAAPDLTLPIDCTLGEDCWIANYMDTNPAEAQSQDFT